MEVRGGNGYIEEWVNARLVRDAHIGLLWEGTNNINTLDIITRAVGREGAQRTLATVLHRKLDAAAKLPEEFRNRLRQALDDTIAFAEASQRTMRMKLQRARPQARFIHATSAVLMGWESCASARKADGARWHARFVPRATIKPARSIEAGHAV